MPGVLNGLESSFAALLQERLNKGEILYYGYEKVAFKLAKKTTWTPDFMVIEADGEVVFMEVKGGWFTDAARVKTKVTASMFPHFKFVLCRKKAGQWFFEEIEPD